jgi:O-antigen ligase
MRPGLRSSVRDQRSAGVDVVNPDRSLRGEWAVVCLGLAVAALLGYLTTKLGLTILVAVCGALACGWLVSHRQWFAPVLMLLGAAIPAGYPFELAFRLRLRYFQVSVVEALLIIALAVALASHEPAKRDGRNRLGATARAAIGGMGLAIVIAIAVGLAFGQEARDMVRDLRLLFLYSAVLLPLLPSREAHFRRLLRMLVLGVTATAVLQIASVWIPALHYFFLADRGRVWFSNGVLYPAALPIALAFALRGRVTGQVYGWSLCFVVMLTGLLLSQTRSHWIAASLSLVVFAALVALGKVRLRGRVLRVGIAATVILFFVFAGVVGLAGSAQLDDATQSIAARVRSLTEARQDSSVSTRAANLDPANAMILDHPIVGTGFGTTFSLRAGSGVVYTTSAVYVDNVPQTLLVKLGILGAIPFVLFWLLVGWRTWGLRRSGSLVGTACAAAVAGMAFMSLTSSYLLASPQIVAVALLAGVVLRDHSPNGGGSW